MTKRFDVCGLGSGIVDILVEVSEEGFRALPGFEKGSMRLAEASEQKLLLDRFHDSSPSLVSGGSIANSVIAVAQLGGRAALLTTLGDDRYGLFYQSECEQLGIALGHPILVGEPTGTCVVLITPDAERTMRTCLGAAQKMSRSQIVPELIRDSRWLFLEGYLLANGTATFEAILHAVSIARESGTKVALSLSEAFVVQAFRSQVDTLLPQLDLVFANESEACALTGAADAQGSVLRLRDMVPGAVVTAGASGVHLWYGKALEHVSAFAAQPRDLTGAGDMLAGAFLYGITHEIPPAASARAACFMAKQVIERVGARLQGPATSYWKEGLERALAR